MRKEISLIINDKTYIWNQKTIYYEEVLREASIKQTTHKVITYSDGPDRNKEGYMEPKQMIWVHHNMIFEVTTQLPLWSLQ